MENENSIKPPSGAAFKRFIDDLGVRKLELSRDMHMSRSNFYRLFEAEEVPWHVLKQAHDALSREYVYDITNYFPEVIKVYPDINKAFANETPMIRSLKIENDYLQRKNLELTEKLNEAYSKIIDGFYNKHIESQQAQLELLRQILNRGVK
jgi:hypothetical protein